MAELLIRVVDKIHPTDPDKNLATSKKGDVISVCPDGWNWGREELANPEWRIVKMPGVDPATLTDMLEADISIIGGQSFIKRKRVRAYNLDGGLATSLIASGQVITLTPVQISAVLSLKYTKPALAQVG